MFGVVDTECKFVREIRCSRSMEYRSPSGHCRWSKLSLSKLLQSGIIERLTTTNLHPNARWLLGERLAGNVKGKGGRMRTKTTKKKMVPRAGFEPARVCETHWPLKPARLPVPPPRHFHAIYIAPTRRFVNASRVCSKIQSACPCYGLKPTF